MKGLMMRAVCLAAMAAGMTADWPAAEKAPAPVPLAVATYVQDSVQERQAEALVKSLRRFGGAWREAPVLVVVAAEPGELPLARLRPLAGVTLSPLEAPPGPASYPLANKAWAAAQAERLLEGRAGTLAWFDPETLVLGPPERLVLGPQADAAFQPVFQSNKVALPEAAAPDPFWRRIYEEAGVKAESVPVVTTFRDEQRVRAYYNCEIYAVRPEKGVLRAWAHALARLVGDAGFQQEACPDFLHRLFLHQAVLSAVVTGRVPPGRLAALPTAAAYPFNLHAQLQSGKKAETLDLLGAAIFEDVWESDPRWADSVGMSAALRAWLDEAAREYRSLAPGVFREERGSGCNSLLVRTSSGDVLVDTGGAPDRQSSWLGRVHGEGPLRAVLLTHAHPDHRPALTGWDTTGTEIVAQEGFLETVGLLNRLAGFYARRNALLQGRPVPAPLPAPPSFVLPTRTFADRFVLPAGDTSFEMIHTGGETPETSLVWIPEKGVLCIADDFYTSFPALWTPRGTQPRNALHYIRALDTALALGSEVLVPGHGEPLTGRERVRQTLALWRDALQYVHDETVRGLNEGRSPAELMKSVRLPERFAVIDQSFGTVAWGVRGICEYYANSFDGSIGSLYGEAPDGADADIAAAAGGPGPLAVKAEELRAAGAFLRALRLADIALRADPRHPVALAARLGSLRGLRKECRNYFQAAFLAAAIRETEARLAPPAPAEAGKTPQTGQSR